MMLRSSAVVAGLLIALGGLAAGQAFEPARLRSGSLPARQPVQVVGGGEVLLELAVGADGAVADVTTLRDTPPFTELLREAAASWRFEPATENAGALAWPVLLAAVFRPPALMGPAPGPAARDLERPCTRIPFPVDRVVPPYPPTALGDGLVLAEVTVGADGQVGDVRSVEGGTPFVQAARDAARQWRFRPACRHDRPVPVRAYLAFGFRSPVTLPRPPGDDP
jgi:outer membrane biosynthesis protein TonB